MLRAIAFCVDEADRVSSLEDATWVRVYERCWDTWCLAREFAPGNLTEFAEALGDCFALVCREIGPNLARSIAGGGPWVWELPGDPVELAEVLWRDQMAA